MIKGNHLPAFIFNKSLLVSLISLICQSPVMANNISENISLSVSEAIEFENGFLMGSQAHNLDLGRFSESNPTYAGTYLARIWINNQPAGQFDIDFVDVGTKSAQACLTEKSLKRLRIRLPEQTSETEGILKQRDEETGDCLELAKLIPQSNVHFDSSDRRLDLTIPQVWLLPTYRNYTDSSLWESGINAAMMSYNANIWQSENNDQNTTSYYAALNLGANLGAWHVRANGNYSATDETSGEFNFQNRYIQRDLLRIRSQLVLGETNTTGETFDSARIKGIRLYSDSRMLPPILSSFAPVIRGVAYSNAKVTLMQGGYKIHETTVPPGPFSIDDFSPSGYGNDIVVLIEEADGSKRTFSVPYNSVTQMLRPGVGRWDISAGKVDNDSLHDEPNIFQSSLYYGLNNYFTGYGGVQITDENYFAGMLGLGMNTPIGALSFDITHSQADIKGHEAYIGQSYRLSWSTMLTKTDTAISMAAYRYSTKNYLGLSDAMELIDDAHYLNLNEGDDKTIDNYKRTKNRFNINVNQPLAMAQKSLGSLYVNASWSDYWNDETPTKDYAIGYSNSYNLISYSVNVMRSYDSWGEKDDSISLSVNIPFSVFSNNNSETSQSGFRSVNATVGSNFNDQYQLMLSSSGNTESGEVSYGINTSQNLDKDSKDITTAGGYMAWESPIGTLGGSASFSNDHARQYSFNTDGGFILHSEGLTFSNNSFSDTDTLALVKAPGAKGARLSAGNNQIDRWGYGVATSLSPYHENDIAINTWSLENDVELKSTSGVVIPRQGSVMLLSFETDEGRSAIINLVREDKFPVPFSAEVFDEQNNPIGNIGQGGQAFVRGIKDKGRLVIRWGDEHNEQCLANYKIPDAPLMLNKSIVLNHVVCQMGRD